MSVNIQQYLDFITTEHRDKPKFAAEIALLAQIFGDTAELVRGIYALFDIDKAIGQQLDVVGEWIGIPRYLQTALPNVFFSWDAEGLGWDRGLWRGPFDPTLGLTRLDDDHYRLLLKAQIVANTWDGSIPGAYEVWDTIFAPEGISILFQDGTPAYIAEFQWDSDQFVGWDYGAWQPVGGWRDYQVTGGMTAMLALIAPPQPPLPPLAYFMWDDETGGWDRSWWDITPQPFEAPTLDVVTMALFNGGYLTLKPAGVRIFYATQSIANAPMFAFDVPFVDGASLAGWDVGAWPSIVYAAPTQVISTEPADESQLQFDIGRLDALEAAVASLPGLLASTSTLASQINNLATQLAVLSARLSTDESAAAALAPQIAALDASITALEQRVSALEHP